MVSEPANQGSPLQQPPILQLVNELYDQIMSQKPSVLYAARVFTEEQDIGLDQCNQILTSLGHICKLIEEFSQFLRPSASFPRILSVNRHRLLIQLHGIEKLTSRDLIPRINAFHTVYWTPPDQLDMQRKEIQRYLESLINSLNKLDDQLKPLRDRGIDPYDSTESADSGSHVPPAEAQVITAGLQSASQRNLTEKIVDTTSVEAQSPADSSAPSSSYTHQLPAVYLEYSTANAVRLRKVIIASFKPEELELVCSDLGLNYHTLKEGPFENKAQYLIDHFHNRGEYERLVRKVLQERPHLEKELRRVVQPSEG